jgi:hypothetical protein
VNFWYAFCILFGLQILQFGKVLGRQAEAIIIGAGDAFGVPFLFAFPVCCTNANKSSLLVGRFSRMNVFSVFPCEK